MGRNGWIAWGAGALTLLALLAVTIPMSARSLAEAEAEAERWAEERALDVVVAGVAPEVVAKDAAGEDYRKLLVRVQAGILADDQASTVRIWRIDGNLLFSTAQRDDVAEVASPDDPSIERAANGEVVSVLTDETTTVPGLQPPRQRLFRTYVPLQPSGATSVMGVVEIDQPYSSIHDPALRPWRLLRVVLGVALVGVLLGFVQSLRHGFAGRSGPSAGVERRDRKRERARSLASRARTRAQPTDDAREPSATSGIDVRAVETRMEELDLKVRAAEAEREQHRAEVKSLRDALEAKEAELALARDGANTRGEARRERKIIAEAHKRAAEAERKSAQAEKKREDAAKRAMEASTRALEMEAQLRSAEETIGALRSELASWPQPAEDGDLVVAPRRRDATDRKAAAELKKAQAELSRAQVERDALADERSRLEAEVQRVEAERAGVEASLAQTRAELQAHIAAASSEAGASMLEERLTTAEMHLADSEERVADAPGRLVRSEASLSDALAKLSELEQTRAALSAELAQLKGVPLDDVAPTDGSVSERPSGGSDDAEPGWDPEPEWSPGPEDDGAEAPDGEDATAGLSLRERLARAAAARHRDALS